MYPNWKYYVPKFLEPSDIMNKCEWFIHQMNYDSFGIMIRGYLQPVQSNSREFTYFWGWNPGDSVLPSELIPAQEETKHYQHLVNPVLWGGVFFNHGDELHDMNDSCLNF